MSRTCNGRRSSIGGVGISTYVVVICSSHCCGSISCGGRSSGIEVLEVIVAICSSLCCGNDGICSSGSSGSSRGIEVVEVLDVEEEIAAVIDMY
jgi:hypothetical protein